MPRSINSDTSLSLIASILTVLFSEHLAREEHPDAPPGWELPGYDVSLLAPNGIVATRLTAILHDDADQCPLSDLITKIRQLPGDVSAERYQVLLCPWFWWLTLANNNRMFQNLVTSDIVTQIFGQHSFSDHQLQLSGSYQPCEYRAQYGRSNLAFVSRLLEEDGTFWFFTRAAGKHTLVLADNNDALPPIPNSPQAAYLGQGIGAHELQGVCLAQYSPQAVFGTYSTTDYKFTTPGTSLCSQAEAVFGATDVYQHPGDYTAKTRGSSLAKRRIDGLRNQGTCLIGEGDYHWLVPGRWFTLSGYGNDSLNINWVLTLVIHDANRACYCSRFEAIPKATAYCPVQITPKPRMYTQTTLVMDRVSGEIWTNRYDRIKIQFPWSRDGKNDETSSCWVRVVLSRSGKGFGIQLVSRIGQEVIVTFIDGDPNRPLVAGCVRNNDDILPHALPGNQMQSGIETSSSKGSDGFNELHLEDKEDAKGVFLQTQKDLNISMLNNNTTSVGHDRTLIMRNARIRTMKEGDETITLEKDKHMVTIQTGSGSLDVKDTCMVMVGTDQTHNTGGNRNHKTSGNFELTMDGNLTIKVSSTLALQSGSGLALRSDTDLTVQAGALLIGKAGTSLTNQADTSFASKVGTSLTSDAGVNLTNKAGAKQAADGGGMLTIRGGLIKVN